MRWSLALAQFVAVLVMWIGGASGVSPINFCQCSKRSLCEPLPEKLQFQVEVLVFDFGGTDYQHYDWSKITAVVISDTFNRHLLCVAHAHNARVIMKGNIPSNALRNHDTTNTWIRQQVDIARASFFDGIYLEQWQKITPGTLEYGAMTQLVNETAEVFHRAIPGSQVSINVPWSPHCGDGPCYDYVPIARSCDFLFVMSIQMQSEMGDECFAKANAPYDYTYSGLSAYINLGIDSRKLVMGVPWYGSDYRCKHFYEPGRCQLEEDSHKEGVCAFHISTTKPYKDIMQELPKSFTGRYWDDNYKSPYYVYKLTDKYHEVWYDDPESLSLKATIVKKLKLRGLGVWFGNFLNYSVNPTAAMQTEDMWNALCPIRRKWNVWNV
ncbi:di-N-acetylchitobiase-like [Scyliorhinus canicula]|uniref:di-N-acetylchitobiase-like n=1 Tax=Scyliorhinus canicula TaxID=7830 RepID=UPI0018F4823A|nr:di-N-acetylchitobiase-like [Scyliorhinus canicula]